MTPKEQKLLDYIREQIEMTGICPTYSEMAEAMGTKGRAAVWEQVERLIANGHLVKLTARRNRGLGLPTSHLATVPTSALQGELYRRSLSAEGEMTWTVNDIPSGLYRVHWRSGGASLAAIGLDEAGRRWIAPTNWIAAGKIDEDAIVALEPILPAYMREVPS